MTEKEQQLVYELNSTEADRILWKTTAIKQGNAIAELKAQVNCLRKAALDAINYMTGGEAKANLRDAYDATPEQCLAEVKAKAIEDAANSCCFQTLNGKQCYAESLQELAKNIREQAK